MARTGMHGIYINNRDRLTHIRMCLYNKIKLNKKFDKNKIKLHSIT